MQANDVSQNAPRGIVKGKCLRVLTVDRSSRLWVPKMPSESFRPGFYQIDEFNFDSADVPVLLSAMQSKPDWMLTHNTKRFTPQVAKRAGLQIGTPADFFRFLSQGIS